jgi:hypothetical protein
MRNLQHLLFLGLVGLVPTPGCTVTTSSTDSSFGGDANVGGSTTGSGGAAVTSGGTSSVTSSVAGATTGGAASSTSTTAAFAETDCQAAGLVAPTGTIADVKPACIACLYSTTTTTTSCVDAVACHNEAGCVAAALKALECIQLNSTYLGYADPDVEETCMEGQGVTPAATPDMTVASTDPTAWAGAAVGAVGSAWITDCVAQCSQ